MPAPALAGGACSAPLKAYAVRVTLPTGQRLEYRALAGCSLAALQTALETHGITRIVIHPTPRKMK